VSEIRTLFEPGPVVLVSSGVEGKKHQHHDHVAGTWCWNSLPPLVACCISNANHSFEMIRRSQECVINVPTTDLVNEVIGIGNCSGAQVDKFKAFGLTPTPATKVSAPFDQRVLCEF